MALSAAANRGDGGEPESAIGEVWNFRELKHQLGSQKVGACLEETSPTGGSILWAVTHLPCSLIKSKTRSHLAS